MKGSKSHELEADVPASELWEIYGTLRYVQLIHELLPQVLHKVELIRGDGGVGTVIQLTVPPRNPGGPPMSYKEEFAEIDDENRVKVAPVVEGGVLNLGFTSYLTRLEIIEKGPSSSVIRSSVDDGRPELEALVRIAPLGVVAEKLVQYVKEQ